MNIEGAKLAAVLQNSASTEGGAPPVSADGGALTGGFADALMGQIESLSETKIQGKLPDPPSNSVAEQPPVLSAGVVLAKIPCNEQKFNPLSGEAPTPSNTVHEDADANTALAELTNMLDYSPVGKGENLPSAESRAGKKDIEGDNKKEDLAPVLSMTEALPSLPPYSGQRHDALSPALAVEGEGFTENSGLMTSPDGLVDSRTESEPLRSSAFNDAMRTDGQRLDDGEVSNQLVPMAAVVPSFADYSGIPQVVNNPTLQTEAQKTSSLSCKPLPEEFKANPPAPGPVLTETLQKSPTFDQFAGREAQSSPNPFGKTVQSMDPSRIEPQPIPSNAEDSLPQGIPEIPPLNRPPTDNKPEVPALMRSLAHPDWNKDLGERIVWMAGKNLSAAEIKLNPQHLGPISVRIEMNNDQATIAFTAQHAAVREAIEASLPKLREMMSHQQLNLVDINVSQNASSDHNQSQSRHAPRHFNGFAPVHGDTSDSGDETGNDRTVSGKGLLSIYA
jgi:flagellar hook-length control protein FliK